MAAMGIPISFDKGDSFRQTNSMKRLLLSFVLMMLVSMVHAEESKEIVKWFRLAAEQGNAIAQTNLGVMYYLGTGVIKDMVEAHAWFNVGSAQGNENARGLLPMAEEEMTKDQIAEATKLAREYFEKYGKEK